MAQTRVKICGCTRPEDAAFAADSGADFVGMNFSRGPRKIGLDKAHAIVEAIRAFNKKARDKVCPVGLIAAPAPGLPQEFWPGELHDSLSLETFQVYGIDHMQMLKDLKFGKTRPEYWYVLPMSSRKEVQAISEKLGELQWKASHVVLDAAVPGLSGGTGQSFDWNWIAEARAAGELKGLPPIILAGGLNPDNVAEAIRIVRPWAVDVSSGVEVKDKPGIKDHAKIRDFIQAAQGA